MSGLKAKIQGEFEQHWRGMLSDYVMAISRRLDAPRIALVF
jgi:hypothetical protein